MHCLVMFRFCFKLNFQLSKEQTFINVSAMLLCSYLILFITVSLPFSFIITVLASANERPYIYTYTVVWKKFTVGYFHVKFVCGKIFSSLGVSNE